MSLSDFSLSSPRKPGAGKGNKSITYDEEFERFLNDVCPLELSLFYDYNCSTQFG